MIKLLRHSTRKASLKNHLVHRVNYIEDREHPNHADKEITCACNYRCGNSSSDFINEVMSLDALYQLERKGRSGRPGRRLFEEIVYSSPAGARLEAHERKWIERKMVALVARKTACRVAWHIDHTTGRSDMHMLLAARTQTNPPATTIWSEFKESRHIFVEFDRWDEGITTFLNSRRPASPLKTARNIRRAKYAPEEIACELAKIATRTVTPENLSELITKAGHKVVSQTERTICIIFKGRKRSLRYNSAKLAKEIDREIKNPKGKQPETPKNTNHQCFPLHHALPTG
jgi:hypothetical protein